ncbi:MAG: NAD(P)-dependent oxidoreductase [Acidobacteriaceae bacterium]|nr:NAD(P)-dependent oxidoreductase [Acidobacteriaceae bacterium]
MTARQRIFVTGGTGYVGSRVIPALYAEGHEVVALFRSSSRSKVPSSCIPAEGNALAGDSYRHHVRGADTFLHLVGVSHPSPAKAREFMEIDLKAGLEAIRVARESNVNHFVFMSVAHPAPVMQAYIQARVECEQAIVASHLNSTILRPWYILGPGHRWPYVLLPFYKAGELFPKTRDGALRLGLLSIHEIVNGLVHVIANPSHGVRVLETQDIRRLQ